VMGGTKRHEDRHVGNRRNLRNCRLFQRIQSRGVLWHSSHYANCWTRPEHTYGVPAFNVNNLEQMRAIMEAAHETTAGDVQASAGARKYAARRSAHLISGDRGWRNPSSCTRTMVRPAVCQRSIQLGFSS